MQYTESVINQMVQFGTIGYPLSKIVNVLDATEDEEFIKDFDDTDSVIAKAYQRGVDKSDFIIDMKLFEMAKAGDMDAIVKFEERKKLQMWSAKKEKILR